MTKTLIEQLLNQFIYVGNVLIGARQIESFLGKFALQPFIWTGYPESEVMLRGTGCGIRFNNRYYLISSAHQLKDIDKEQVGLFVGDTKYLVTSSGSFFFNADVVGNESDQHDVVVFDFSEASEENPELKSLFFDFPNSPPDCTNVDVIALVSAGFPSSEQDFDVHENNHVGSLKRIILSRVDSQPRDYSVLIAKPVARLEFDPDGLSGGPVFAIINESVGPRAHFAGMMVRANRDYIHFLKSGFIHEVLQIAQTRLKNSDGAHPTEMLQ